MIRVEPAPEPPDFDQDVRRPGRAAIAELIGEAAGERPGPHREKVAERPEDIPPAAFPPFWRRALPDMLESYHRLCAYLSLYIEHATGARTVDHVIPRSKAWDQVYEWPNYRLACALMNSRKGATDRVLDPFQLEDDWFALELVEFQVKVGSGAQGAIAERVEATIEQLGLNDTECLRAREEYVKAYLEGHIDHDYLCRRAPFVARELERQGRLLEADG